MKTNLKDVTFLIPVRIDSMVRLENLQMSVSFLLKNFDTNILVLEATNYNNRIVEKMLGKKVEYLFFEDKDTVFYRTKYLNIMTNSSATPYVAIWDADVILPKKQILESVGKLKEGYEIAYPYDGHFYDTSYVLRELYIKKPRINTLLKNKDMMGLIYGTKMRGGALLVNKAAYQAAGMENENFYGWGPEDWERAERWDILGYNVYIADGPLFHLTHSRGINSTFRSMEQLVNTSKELRLTRQSSKEEIILKIKLQEKENVS